MPIWTLLTIRDHALERSGLNSSQISNAEVDEIINRIYVSLLPLESEGLPIGGFGTIVTSIGVGVYDIPGDTFRIGQPITLDDGGGGEVKTMRFFLDPAEFFKEYPDNDSLSNSEPESVLLYGNENSTSDKDNQLYVRPIADAVYTIKFTTSTRPQLLVNDSDVPVDEDTGYYIAIQSAIEILNVKAGGSSPRKEDLLRDLTTHTGNLNTKKIKQLTGKRSKPRF